MLMSFNDYQDKSILESRKKIKILHKILDYLNVKNKVFLKGQDPYIYVNSPYDNSEIPGIRIYPIANKIAFKLQKGPKDLPQGRPYLLDFEKIYGEIVDDYVKTDKNKDEESDNSDEKAAKKVAEQFLETLKQFFKTKSNNKVDSEKAATINLGTDYSSLLYSKY